MHFTRQHFMIESFRIMACCALLISAFFLQACNKTLIVNGANYKCELDQRVTGRTTSVHLQVCLLKPAEVVQVDMGTLASGRWQLDVKRLTNSPSAAMDKKISFRCTIKSGDLELCKREATIEQGGWGGSLKALDRGCDPMVIEIPSAAVIILENTSDDVDKFDVRFFETPNRTFVF